MNDMEKAITNAEGDNKEKWEFSKEIGKLTVRKIVEKIDNGFLLITNVYGRKEGSEDYIDKSTKSYHKENPLADMIKYTDSESSKEDDKSSMDSAFDPFNISTYIKK